MIVTDHEFEEGRSNHSDTDAGLHQFDIHDNFLEVSPDDELYSFTGFYSKSGWDCDCTDVTVFNNY